eukprot:scaffold312963_cov17-Prasinocladus_malaysianus.AAC.1
MWPPVSIACGLWAPDFTASITKYESKYGTLGQVVLPLAAYRTDYWLALPRHCVMYEVVKFSSCCDGDDTSTGTNLRRCCGYVVR